MFGKRLAALRKQKGMSQYDLAGQLDLSRGQLSNYELETREPDFETLRRITNYFDVSADYLLGFSDNAAVYKVPPAKKLPVLGALRSGIPLLADENLAGYMEVPDYITADYIFEVKDNSMADAGILKDDYVLCRKAKAAQAGQVVLAIKDLHTGCCQGVIRFYIEENKRKLVLRSASTLYPDLSIKEGYKVIGVIASLFRQEIPGYKAYQAAKAPDAEQWAEIIDLSSQANLKASQVKDILTGQIEIIKKLSQS